MVTYKNYQEKQVLEYILEKKELTRNGYINLFNNTQKYVEIDGILTPQLLDLPELPDPPKLITTNDLIQQLIDDITQNQNAYCLDGISFQTEMDKLLLLRSRLNNLDSSKDIILSEYDQLNSPGTLIFWAGVIPTYFERDYTNFTSRSDIFTVLSEQRAYNSYLHKILNNHKRFMNLKADLNNWNDNFNALENDVNSFVIPNLCSE